jgi:E3 ubiquitin-protein ligase HECTD2
LNTRRAEAVPANQRGPQQASNSADKLRVAPEETNFEPRLTRRNPSDSKSLPLKAIQTGGSNRLPGKVGYLEPRRSSGSHLQLPPTDKAGGERSDFSDHERAGKPQDFCDTIFRPVENYITSCFNGCATLNTSFLTVRPEFNRAASEGHSTRPVPNQSHLSPPRNDNAVTEVEVDAKTLLLGDIAENSSWWTGERLARGHSTHGRIRERSPDAWRGVVSLKTPRISWVELASWYRSILTAGDSWLEKWNALQPNPLTKPSNIRKDPVTMQDLVQEIEGDMIESRNHLQRVLLKATENLLKRPRRPLKHPEDCRFLLIILANPLLFTSGSSLQPRRSNPEPSSKRSGPGKHSGIVKRVLGLMAYMPNEVHQFLVSWFSRFSESQFQRYVDLVGGFVTHRLSRQPQKRQQVNPTDGLVPSFSDSGTHHASQLHAALGGSRSTSSKPTDSSGKTRLTDYSDDWQIRAAARAMALLFAANGGHTSKKREAMPNELKSHSAGLTARHSAHAHGQLIPISSFYNTMLDYADLVADFEVWESNRGKFSFCQYPFFLSIYAKIHLMEMEARRQMEIKAREAFFDSILSNKAVSQFLVLKVRRDCLVEDSYVASRFRVLSLLRARLLTSSTYQTSAHQRGSRIRPGRHQERSKDRLRR